MKNLLFSLLLPLSLLSAGEASAHRANGHHNHHGTNRVGGRHNHCHYHQKKDLFHCHSHTHMGPGDGHHGRRWMHPINSGHRHHAHGPYVNFGFWFH